MTFCFSKAPNGAFYYGSLTKKYIPGPGIDNPIVMINVSGTTETWYYYFTDALGSIRLITDDEGTIKESYTYDPFGRPYVMDSTTGGSGNDVNWLTRDTSSYTYSPLGNPYMFTARRWDYSANLYYYRFRDYQPDLGRFCQPDPLGYIDGMNLYAYCGNNPLNWLDPWGLDAKEAAEVEKEEIIEQAEELVKEDPAYFPIFNDCGDQNERIAQQVMKNREYWYHEPVGRTKRESGWFRGNHSVTKVNPTSKAVKGIDRDKLPKSWVLDVFHGPFWKRDVTVMDWEDWEKKYPYDQPTWLELLGELQVGGTLIYVPQ
jgi:RHS repeat-associated protein